MFKYGIFLSIGVMVGNIYKVISFSWECVFILWIINK